MKTPLVSVIVPVYKVEPYLHKCVDSILAQTYTNLEIFLVDDGSPDNCGKICDEYAQKDNRIRVIHKKNGGLSDARNVAIDVATGEYITFVDSDDYVDTDYVDYLYQLVLQNQCQVAIVQSCFFYENTNPNKKRIAERIEVFSSIEAIKTMFYQKHIETSAWGKLYHKSLFETGIRYPRGILFEDNPVTFRLLYQSNQVVVSNKQLYFYLIRSDSIEGSLFNEVKIQSAVAVLKLMHNYPEITNLIVPAFKCKIISLTFHFILKMPIDSMRTKMLYRLIVENRKSVLFNHNARLKARLACLISYLGLSATQKIFRLIDTRKS